MSSEMPSQLIVGGLPSLVKLLARIIDTHTRFEQVILQQIARGEALEVLLIQVSSLLKESREQTNGFWCGETQFRLGK